MQQIPSQKEVKAEVGAARGDEVVEHQEDVVPHEDGVAREASEVTVVAGALEVAVSTVEVVAVAEVLGEVVVVTEDHDIVFVYLGREFIPHKGFIRVKRCH